MQTTFDCLVYSMIFGYGEDAYRFAREAHRLALTLYPDLRCD